MKVIPGTDLAKELHDAAAYRYMIDAHFHSRVHQAVIVEQLLDNPLPLNESRAVIATALHTDDVMQGRGGRVPL